LATIPEAFDIAVAHHRAERLKEAETIYRQILAAEPNHIGSLTMLAAIGHQTRHHAAALALMERALALDPNLAASHYGRAVALHGLGRLVEAEAEFEQAITLKPDYVEAMHNLAALQQNTGRTAKAIETYRRVLAIRPDYADAYTNMGVALRDESRYAEAAESLRAALRLDPKHPESLNNLGVVLKAQGRTEEAVPFYEQALAVNPDYIGPLDNILMGMNYRPGPDGAAMLRAHRGWDERFGRPRAPAEPVPPNDPDPERRLRIGYVSPDFRRHSVAYFFEPLLACHDPAEVETFCYSNDARGDEVTLRLNDKADHWRQVHARDEAAIAGLVRIDILVDLAGHSSGNLLPVFARKPAPVQVTWLGYPNTTGLSAIDYRLTDAIADPPGAAEAFHSERLEYLPHGFLCYRPPDTAPPVGPLPALATGHVTFGSFNNLAKITPEVVAAWAAVLHRVPGSRLLLKAGAFGDAEGRARYVALFAAAGIPAERLDLVAQIPGTAAHLAAYDRLDIALDPFPYNGTTTTCEALWMGVPVLTLAGRLHAGRVGASLLVPLGLEAWIAADEDDYVAAAARLAANLPALAALRARLRPCLAQAPLCDAAGFARQMEAAYRRMWRRALDARGAAQ
jgi:protein O-GlcNAc transferase